MSNNDLERIINNLNSLGNNIFYNGIDEDNIINFENDNNIKLPNQLKGFIYFLMVANSFYLVVYNYMVYYINLLLI